MKYQRSLGKDKTPYIEAILLALAQKIDEVEFLHQLTTFLLQTNGGSRPNFSPDFEVALFNGNLKAARFFFENRDYDLIACREDTTLLGRLIQKSKHYRNVGKKIDFLLSLAPDTDIDNDRIFWNTYTHGGSNGSSFTAIQQATLHTEFRPRLRSDHSVLQVILDRFHQPRYLNAPVGEQMVMYSGHTAFHLAVAGGNIPATDMLLQRANKGLDVNKLNTHGESPVEICLLRWRSAKNELEFWDIQKRDQELEESHRDERTVSLMAHLHNAGGEYHRYSQVITRTEERVICLLNMEEKSKSVKIQLPDTSPLLEAWPEEHLVNPPYAAVVNLKVGQSLFISRVDGNLHLSSTGSRPVRLPAAEFQTLSPELSRDVEVVDAAPCDGSNDSIPDNRIVG